MEFPTPETVAHIKQLYHDYRHSATLEARGVFFSPRCMQICRQEPSWAAKNRETIVHYLRETSRGKDVIFGYLKQPTPPEPVNAQKNGHFYTIRPLVDSEIEFGSDEMSGPVGLTTAQLKHKVDDESWVGMRVDMWEDEGEDAGKLQGLAVKVQYWWRKEGDVWLQILHDIMYIGPRDGSEGQDGPVLQ